MHNLGTVFLAASNGSIVTLANFDGKAGQHPASAVVLTENGYLLGTAPEGGTAGKGTIYCVSPLGTLRALVTFTGSNGAAPLAGLCRADDGFYYGTASAGGAANLGTIFKVNAQGDFSTVFTFTGPNGASPKGGLIRGPDGKLYGTTEAGGNFGKGTVFRFTVGGQATPILHFDGKQGASPRAALLLANDGNFYGSLSTAPGFFKMSPAGERLPWVNGGDRTSDYSLVQGGDDALYATTGRAILRITTAGVVTVVLDDTTPNPYSPSFGNLPGYPHAALVKGADDLLYFAIDPSSDYNDYMFTRGRIARLESGGTLGTVAAFGADGVDIRGALLQGADGAYYGTTRLAGSAGQGFPSGNVFKVTANGGFTKVRPFVSPDVPRGGLSPGANPGRFWGVADMGSFGFTVYELFNSQYTPIIQDYNTISYNPRGPVTRIDEKNFLLVSDFGVDRWDYYQPLDHRGMPAGPARWRKTSLAGVKANAPIVIGTDGNYYGTERAAAGTHGSVFKITPAGVYTQLHAFDGVSAGTPLSGLLQASDGNLYGATSRGGPADAGAFYKVDANGQVTIVAALDHANGASPSAAPTEAPDGTLYGVAEAGGAHGYGTIFSYTAANGLTGVYSFDGVQAGYPSGALLRGADGAYYGPARHAVFRFDPDAPNTVTPDLALGVPQNVTLASVTLTGVVKGNGVTGVETYFEISADPLFPAASTVRTTPEPLAGGAGEVARTAVIQPLSANTTYYARLVAGHSSGSAFSNVRTFTVGDVTIITAMPGAVTGASASFSGSINPYGLSGTAYFEYSTDIAFPAGGTQNTVGVTVGPQSGSVPLAAEVAGLAQQTTYHVRAVLDAGATVRRGNTVSFTTPLLPPGGVLTLAPSGVTSDSVTMRGSVSGVTSPTVVSFAYGSTTQYGNVLEVATVTADQQFSFSLVGFQPGTQYHYQAVASTAGGTVRGADRAFTTSGSNTDPDPVSPAVTTQSVSSIGSTGAILNGMVTGVSASVPVSFSYGPTPDYGSTLPAGTAAAGGAFSAQLQGLAPGTVCHYRAEAVVGQTVILGGDRSFTVGNQPPIAADDLQYVSGGSSAILIDVRANDADPEGQPLTIISAGGAAFGATTIESGRIQYSPNPGFSGQDTFTYTVRDAGGLEATAAVELRNAYAGRIGSFQGLLAPNDAGRRGLLNLTFTASGHFTARWQERGASVPLMGILSFSGDLGTAHHVAAEGPLPGTGISVQFHLQTGALTATIDDPAGAIPVDLKRIISYTAASPTPRAGRYTALLPAPADTNLPRGTGYATLTVSPLGQCVLAGKLGDGKAFAAAASLSDFGAGKVGLSVFAKVYAAPVGSLSGTLQFDDVAGVSDFAGTLAWHKPAQTAGPLAARGGFTTTVDAIGSTLVRAPRTPLLDFTFPAPQPDARALFTGAGLAPAGAAFTGRLTNQNIIASPNPARLRLAINPANGLFTGSFAAPGVRGWPPFYGAVLQKKNIGGGLFVAPAGTGAVLLEARQ